ncbi:MAG: B12-binding domain-containing radical SAM protein [Candidatus Xenobiia bacterium LiM19]
MRTVLIFPPQWIPLNPHFSLCSLSGTLQGEGIDVIIEDLNVKFYRSILTEKYLNYSYGKAINTAEYLRQKITLTLTRKDTSHAAQCESARLLAIEQYMEDGRKKLRALKKKLPSAIAAFDEKERFYNPFDLVMAFITVDEALELISLPFFPARIRFNDYFTPVFPLTTDGLTAFTEDRDENMFIPFMKKEASRILKEAPDLTGISINSPTQLLPGLTLSRILMKNKDHRCHINIGGNYFTRLQEVIQRHPEFFTLFTDSFILGEGEKPLLSLVRALERKESLERVPSLIYADREKGGAPCFTFKDRPVPLDLTHIQSLDGLSLKDYFVPEPVISIQSGKGCYWQQCTFCDTDFGIDPDIKSIDRIIDELRLLQEKYGIQCFEFIDESIPPDYMERLAERILKEKLDISWFSNARTESTFTEERLKLFRKSGLLMLLWGIETGNPRIMKLINKGVDFIKRVDILRASDEAGIWNFAYIFFGFPSETWEEALQTVDLIRDNINAIHSYGRSIFTLGRHARLKDLAGKMGLVRFLHDDQEFSTSLSYESITGMTPCEIMEMTDHCKYRCADAYGEPLWMYLRYREVLFLYIHHHGMKRVLNHCFTREEREAVHRTGRADF